MPTMQLAGRELELNKKGHMAQFDAWDREIAEALAEEDGLALTDCHWAVIEFLRDFYTTHEIAPPPRVVIKNIGQEISAHVPCTRKHLEALFPQGGCKQACRIAGLPDYYCHPY
jgi:tRNA 2-thiouridine synthesizing protein E